MVPPRRFRSSRPPSVSSGRLLPPRLSAVPAAVLVAVLTLTCAVLGASPAAAQPAIPVPPPATVRSRCRCPWSPRRPTRSRAAPRPRATPPRRRTRLRRRPAPAPNPSPAPAPTDAAGAAAQLRQVQQEAEALTEQWHAAQDDVTARRAERGHPARRDRPGPRRGRRRTRRRGALPRAGRHRRAVDVRERAARRVQRPAGQSDRRRTTWTRCRHWRWSPPSTRRRWTS